MRLQLATWPEVEAYLATSRSVIMPIGSTEQHGPNGMIGTDALTADAIAKGVGEATGALVAPPINVGMAQHHMAFAGSMTLRPSTLVAVVRDCVVSLARHGFERFFFINGHGGNIATVSAAFSEIYAEASLGAAGNRAGLKCVLRNWWENAAVRGLSKELYGNAEGGHATPSEVSVTWFLHPDDARSADRTAWRRLRRRARLSAPLPRWPHRLQSGPLVGRGGQAHLRRRGRGPHRGLPVVRRVRARCARPLSSDDPCAPTRRASRMLGKAA
jgi:creatinine amidohydrolase